MAVSSNKWKSVTAVTLLAVSLSACAEGHEKEGAGTLLGAALGAWLGSTIDDDGVGGAAAITLGAVAGAAIGNSIGKSLDKADRLAMYQTQQQAFESSRSYETSEWYNPDSGNRGTVTPKPAYKNDEGEYCREYQQTVTVGGKQEQAYGTACRQPDGSWKIVN